MYPASSSPRRVDVPAPLETFPLLVQGGSILPIRERVRRSSTLMWRDPYTLLVTAGKDDSASGDLYVDDGDSYAYRQGQYIHRRFDLKVTNKRKLTLSSINLVGLAENAFISTDVTVQHEDSWTKAMSTVRVEQVVILGLSKEPTSITAGGIKVSWEWTAGTASTSRKEGEASQLVIKDPRVLIAQDWEIVISS
jgi:mannosyl-oligosaccharide alpha-1,3-glucosidase